MSEDLNKTASEIAAHMGPTRGETFRRELATLLNRYSLENTSNTPDYMLADYLIECLRSLDVTINRREGWYGRRG